MSHVSFTQETGILFLLRATLCDLYQYLIISSEQYWVWKNFLNTSNTTHTFSCFFTHWSTFRGFAGWKKVTINSIFHVIHVALDDYIPFCEFFVIPYYLWFVYMAVGIIFIAFTDGKLCWRMGIFLITGMTTFLFISTVYPNGQLLRPETFARNNIFVHIVQKLYATDTPTNLFPSIHVYNSLGIYFALCHSEKIKKHKWIKYAALMLTICIILSTMFIKQHSVFDVLTAFALAAFMYSVCYGAISVAIERRRQKRIPAGQI